MKRYVSKSILGNGIYKQLAVDTGGLLLIGHTCLMESWLLLEEDQSVWLEIVEREDGVNSHNVEALYIEAKGKIHMGSVDVQGEPHMKWREVRGIAKPTNGVQIIERGPESRRRKGMEVLAKPFMVTGTDAMQLMQFDLNAQQERIAAFHGLMDALARQDKPRLLRIIKMLWPAAKVTVNDNLVWAVDPKAVMLNGKPLAVWMFQEARDIENQFGDNSYDE